MGREPIPEELRRFLLTSVPSVPFVEAMLIFRESRAEPIAVETLARRLYMGVAAAAEIVEQLRAAHLIEPAPGGPGHRFAPAPAAEPAVEMLSSFYRTHLVEVTDIIHSRTGRMAQRFADAFRLRKDD